MTPVIEMRDANVVFTTRTGSLFHPTKVHANKDINLAIHHNEVVGIVGESGCGKSTLARVMVGLQEPTSGQVLFNGKKLRPRRQRKELGQTVSVVFQDPATSLNPRMNVHDQLLDPLRVHKVGTAATREARVRELIELVGLPASTLEVLPRQISGGPSASASPSRVPWRSARRSSSPTSPPRLSTSPCAPKCSICW